MSCIAGVRRNRRKSPAVAQLSLAKGQNGFEIAGTWDFKWHLGTTIRVAFQRLPLELKISDSAFDRARDAIITYAKRWELPPGIRVEFLPAIHDLAPPLGPQHSLTDQHRSPFLPNAPLDYPYDVLVSLQPLPAVRIDPFRPFGEEQEDVLFPLSELGSYSRRADYGSPTVFLGPFGKLWPGTGDPSAAFEAYFASAMGQHVAVHEFGHVLGLPHSHQHPHLVLPAGADHFTLEQIDLARREFYRKPLELKAVMETIFGVEVNDQMVTGHLLAAWAGNMEFSDWLDFTKEELDAHAKLGELDSVMRLPFYNCTVQKHTPCQICQTGVYDGTQLITAPRTRDKNTLQFMYDPVYQDQVLNPRRRAKLIPPKPSGHALLLDGPTGSGS